jgi:hypothetical protein
MTPTQLKDWRQKMMTFEQFQASKTECPNLGERLDDARWEDEPTPASGLVYAGDLYIERVADHWPAKARTEGKWYLILCNEEYISDDLENLERKLYAFAKGEEVI